MDRPDDEEASDGASDPTADPVPDAGDGSGPDAHEGTTPGPTGDGDGSGGRRERKSEEARPGARAARREVGNTEQRREGGLAGRADRREDGGESEWWTFARDVVSSAVAVFLVGGFIFAVSGVWPPMVAVESPSMTPNMQTGDLVFVMEEHRFAGEAAQAGTGVVTARTGRTTDVDYEKFGREGDVIVYKPDGNGAQTPIIHRAMFWVEAGENWYDKADRQAVGRYSECGDEPDEALPNCPAPHAGFITKGDANGAYDQAQGLSEPVKPSWVIGTAELRVPKLGCIRLRTRGCAQLTAGPVGGVAGDPGVANATAGG